MGKIIIEQKTVKVVSKIEIDGKEYPITQWNREKAQNYLITKDEKFLKELKDFTLEF